ncbi:MAG: 4'-phosphopantetheinyl transferase superfamily protein [Candidatus Wallbacteria bacterium]
MTGIKIYAACIKNNSISHLLGLYSGILNRDEKMKVNSFRFEADSLRSIGAILLLKHSLMKNLNIGPLNVELEKNANGKVYLKGRNDFYFNISHSGDFVLLAFYDSEVGIDIEKIEPVDLSMNGSYFSPEECERFKSIPKNSQIDYFYELWTLKESYIKYLGTGLSLEPTKFVLDFNDDSIKVSCQMGFNTNCNFKRINDFKGYKAALCACGNQNISYEINYIDLEKLQFL